MVFQPNDQKSENQLKSLFAPLQVSLRQSHWFVIARRFVPVFRGQRHVTVQIKFAFLDVIYCLNLDVFYRPQYFDIESF